MDIKFHSFNSFIILDCITKDKKNKPVMYIARGKTKSEALIDLFNKYNADR